MIPLIALTQGVPSRLGFHMFARETFVRIGAFDAQGRSVPIETSDWIVGRPELGWRDVLPEAICHARPDVALVTVADQDGTRTLTCR